MPFPALGFIAAAFATSLAAGTSPAPQATAAFRHEHAQVRKEMEEVAAVNGRLATSPPAQHKELMARVVSFFEQHIRPHAAWEERVLYPAVDKRAGGRGSAGETFTASMRFEHRVVTRWVEELSGIAAAPQPDAVAFARRADNLLGLVSAHFEAEEQVLLPVLDRAKDQKTVAHELASHH
jgi:hemerythrin-like domain-containing protein